MRKIIVYCSILVFLIQSLPTQGQVSKFQALYLVNFSKNLEWNRNDITIGVVGNTKTLVDLESLTAKYPEIKLKKISGSESVSDCQLIFLPSAQSRNFSLIQGKIGKAPIILVTEDESLVGQGAEIGFYLEGNRLKFSINKSALDKTGVKASSKLLDVAKIVN